jgi:uncharacterized membrane protein (DUF2068 family)
MTEPSPVPSSPATSERVGVRLIAVLEAAKAALILATGFGLLALVHRDVEAVAANIVRHLHINPASHYPRIFIDASRNLTDDRLRMLAALAFCDAVLRGIEAVGLWRNRDWGKWLGVATGAIYLPFEVLEVFRHVTALKIAAVVLNVGIVVYLVSSMRKAKG